MNYTVKETENLLRHLLSLPAEQIAAIQADIENLLLAINSQNERHRKYAESVRKMRNIQKAYFSASKEKDWSLSRQILAEAKIIEKDIDNETDEIISGAVQIVLF